MYMFNTIPIKISAILFVNTGMIILKWLWKRKEARITKINFKIQKVGRISFPDFKTCYIATVIESVWYWQRDDT